MQQISRHYEISYSICIYKVYASEFVFIVLIRLNIKADALLRHWLNSPSCNICNNSNNLKLCITACPKNIETLNYFVLVFYFTCIA